MENQVPTTLNLQPSEAAFVEQKSPNPTSGCPWHQAPDGQWYYWSGAKLGTDVRVGWIAAMPQDCALVCLRPAVVNLGNYGTKQVVPADSIRFGRVTIDIEKPELARIKQPNDGLPKGLLRYAFKVEDIATEGFAVVCGATGWTILATCDAKQDADELAFALNLAVSAWAMKVRGSNVVEG